MPKLIALSALCALLAALALPAGSLAGAPVVHDHANFTSASHADNWCGIDGTSVDRVVEQYAQDASGAFVDTISVKTLFTATSGKSMLIQTAGLGKGSAPIVNGDGTFTSFFTGAGLGPKFSLPNGAPLVIDVGLVGFAVTLDANGNFVSFEVLFVKGPHPAGCDTIVAALKS